MPILAELVDIEAWLPCLPVRTVYMELQSFLLDEEFTTEEAKRNMLKSFLKKYFKSENRNRFFFLGDLMHITERKIIKLCQSRELVRYLQETWRQNANELYSARKILESLQHRIYRVLPIWALEYNF